MYAVKRIESDVAVRFLTANKANKEGVLIRPLDMFLGAYSGDELVGVGGYCNKKNYIEIAGIYVRPDYRLKGIATILTENIIASIPRNQKVISNAKFAYAQILEKQGFVLTHTFKNNVRMQMVIE